LTLKIVNLFLGGRRKAGMMIFCRKNSHKFSEHTPVKWNEELIFGEFFMILKKIQKNSKEIFGRQTGEQKSERMT
jgi:hypothetical protein